MDTNYTTQLFLSMLFFAPGIVLFVGLAFVGLLMAMEKTIFRGQTSQLNLSAQTGNIDFTANANPAPGAIVQGLKQATTARDVHATQEAHKTRKVANQ